MNKYSFPIILDKQKTKQVIILMPLHREGLTSYLSPMLGQYGVRNIDFVNSFVNAFNTHTHNLFSKEIIVDDLEAGLSDEILTVPIYLTAYKGGKYNMTTGLTNTGSLYRTMFKRKRRYFKAGNSYRNIKKIYQLTLLMTFSDMVLLDFNKYFAVDICTFLAYSKGKRLKIYYKHIRNSIQRKR